MSLEVVSGEGRGEKVLTFKVVYHTCGHLFFLYWERLREEKRTKVGRREITTLLNA